MFGLEPEQFAKRQAGYPTVLFDINLLLNSNC